MTSETPVPPTFRHLTTWHLANLAGCGSPDRPDGIGVSPPADLSTVDPSPGAKFLRSVADDTAERIAYRFAWARIAGSPASRRWWPGSNQFQQPEVLALRGCSG